MRNYLQTNIIIPFAHMLQLRFYILFSLSSISRDIITHKTASLSFRFGDTSVTNSDSSHISSMHNCDMLFGFVSSLGALAHLIKLSNCNTKASCSRIYDFKRVNSSVFGA